MHQYEQEGLTTARDGLNVTVREYLCESQTHSSTAQLAHRRSGPAEKVNDQYDQQDDHEDPDQSVARSSHGKHLSSSFVGFTDLL